MANDGEDVWLEVRRMVSRVVVDEVHISLVRGVIRLGVPLSARNKQHSANSNCQSREDGTNYSSSEDSRATHNIWSEKR